MITEQQIKEIERVCGKDFTWRDVPAIWKQEWLEKGLMTKQEWERLNEEDEKYDYHPRPEEVK